MQKRYLTLWVFGLIGLGLISYNYWSYSCGRCNAESLLSFSLPAKILIGTNLFALAVLFMAKLWSRDRKKAAFCTCGQQLLSSWHFCPCCGHGKLQQS